MWLCSLPCQLLESRGRVSGFSHTRKGSAQSSAPHRSPARAVEGPAGHVSTLPPDSKALEAPTHVTQDAGWLSKADLLWSAAPNTAI